MMQILEKNVSNIWGEKGREWINALPVIIEKLSKIWSLTEVKPVNNMSWNFVALAIHENKIPVVLKISCDQELIQQEYKALKHFDGKGAINVLFINEDYNSLLLEQAVPGHSLKEYHTTKFAEKIYIYSQVVKTLVINELTNGYPHVSSWCDAIDRIQDSRIEKNYVDKARQLRSLLLKTAPQEYLCHGDLHFENILQHNSSWVAIDPKGIIGEMAFEAAAFDLLCKDEMQNGPVTQAKIIDRIHQLSLTLEINPDRLIAWIFLRIIISAQWFIEDNGDPNQMLTLANYIYPLLGNKLE